MMPADYKAVAADVYAGDTTSLDSSTSTDTSTSIFLFRIEADPEPDVLSRVASIFNIANEVPRRADLRRDSPDQVNICVEIELSRPETADMIRRKLQQLTCTIAAECVAVDSPEKRPSYAGALIISATPPIFSRDSE